VFLKFEDSVFTGQLKMSKYKLIAAKSGLVKLFMFPLQKVFFANFFDLQMDFWGCVHCEAAQMRSSGRRVGYKHS
jgi:hypothetical protein